LKGMSNYNKKNTLVNKKINSLRSLVNLNVNGVHQFIQRLNIFILAGKKNVIMTCVWYF